MIAHWSVSLSVDSGETKHKCPGFFNPSPSVALSPTGDASELGLKKQQVFHPLLTKHTEMKSILLDRTAEDTSVCALETLMYAAEYFLLFAAVA